MRKIAYLSDGLFVLVPLAMLVIVLARVAWAWPISDYDPLVRYAPMAEAFAHGNWHEAFHPRFGILFPILTGLGVRLLSIDGLQACVFVSLVFWALCAIPIWHIAQVVFGRLEAWIAVILYLICPLTLQYAFEGLREPVRMFGLLVMVSTIFRVIQRGHSSWKDLIGLVSGAVIMILIKIDSLAFAGFLTLVYVLINRFRAQSWILLGIVAAICQAPCWLVWHWTGWWVPVLPLIPLLQKVIS